MLETVLEKLNKAKELIEEAREIASKHDIELIREIYYMLEVLGDGQTMARKRQQWDSSTDKCTFDPNYLNYV